MALDKEAKDNLKGFMKSKGLASSAVDEPDEVDNNESTQPDPVDDEADALHDQVGHEIMSAIDDGDHAKFVSSLKEFVADCMKKY